MPGREIVADHDGEPTVGFIELAPHLLARRQRIIQHPADQMLLGLEMDVERAVGQPGLGHDAGKPGGRHAARAKLARGDIEDALPRLILMSLLIPRNRPPPSPVTTSFYHRAFPDNDRYCITCVI